MSESGKNLGIFMYRMCNDKAGGGVGGGGLLTLVPVLVLLKTGSVPVITRPSCWKRRRKRLMG